MSHKEQKEFCNSIKQKLPSFFQNKKVLEIGSGDINGNNNYLFIDCHMIRLDVFEGPNVDLVSFAHELKFVDNYFDTIISTECLEHDRYYDKTLLNALRMLRGGGLFLFTCATTGRPEHGTRRSKPYQVFTTRLDNLPDYYKNITEQDVRAIIDIDKEFIEYEFSVDTGHCDLFFWGIKR